MEFDGDDIHERVENDQYTTTTSSRLLLNAQCALGGKGEAWFYHTLRA